MPPQATPQGRPLRLPPRALALARSVAALVRRERLFDPDSRALVMVSGGQDSVALLHLLASGILASAGPAAILALHVNHHLRGEESDADERLVRDVCAEFGIELEVRHVPVTKAEGDVQERAREGRLREALALLSEAGASVVATGHTLDDQVETMLYRLGRYGGLRALRGMRPRDGRWVRPMLGLRRGETETYCRAVGLRFAVDSGNAYPGYARTGIRERLLPLWEDMLPGAAPSAARAAEVAAEAAEIIDEVLRGVETSVQMPGGDAAGEVRLSAAKLRQLSPPVRRAYFHRLIADHVGEGHAARQSVLALEGLALGSGYHSLDLGGGWQAVKDGAVLRLSPTSAHSARSSQPSPPVVLPLPGSVSWGEYRLTAELVERFQAPEIRREAYVDRAFIAGHLVVRAPQAGDRIHALGAPGSRKLSDLFTDLHVPRSVRATVPLVVSDATVIWVGGYAAAHGGRITATTTEIVHLTMTRGACGEA